MKPFKHNPIGPRRRMKVNLNGMEFGHTVAVRTIETDIMLRNIGVEHTVDLNIPERELMRRMVYVGLMDVARADPELKEDGWEWISGELGEASKWIFSARNCCEVLGIDYPKFVAEAQRLYEGGDRHTNRISSFSA